MEGQPSGTTRSAGPRHGGLSRRPQTARIADLGLTVSFEADEQMADSTAVRSAPARGGCWSPRGRGWSCVGESTVPELSAK